MRAVASAAMTHMHVVVVLMVVGTVTSAPMPSGWLLSAAESSVMLRGDDGTHVQMLAQVEGGRRKEVDPDMFGDDRAKPCNTTTTDKTIGNVNGTANRARGDDLRPVQLKQDVLNSALADPSDYARNGSSCPKHKTEFRCIVDVACGWCLQPKGAGQCVAGTYAGPSPPYKTTVYCPVYTTYQVYLPPEPPGSEDAFKHMFDSLSRNGGPEHNFDADLLPNADDAAVEAAPMDVPHPDVRNDYGLNEDNVDVGEEADRETKKNDLPDIDIPYKPKPPKRRVKSVEPHTIAAVPADSTMKGFGKDTSPCGLPGVPQAFCDAWLKTHCGPDDLSDDHIKSMRAANNPYDWCKLMFENEPGISLPEVDVFPWMINNQEVDLSPALRDKIRFGHPLAGQGVSWDKVQSLNLIRPPPQAPAPTAAQDDE